MTAQDLGAIASEGTLQRIATALEGMSSGGGGGSSAKLYRHDIDIQEDDPMYTIRAKLTVYRTTDTQLTLADLSDGEIASATFPSGIVSVYDSNSGNVAGAVPQCLFKSGSSVGIRYWKTFLTESPFPYPTTNDDYPPFALTDTVTEV